MLDLISRICSTMNTKYCLLPRGRNHNLHSVSLHSALVGAFAVLDTTDTTYHKQPKLGVTMSQPLHPMLVLANEEEAARYQELEDLESFRSGTEDAPVIYKAAGFGDYQMRAEGDEVMDFVASEESEDRFGDIIEAKGWRLTNFKRNPVFLFAHNSRQPAVGRVTQIGIGPSEDSKQLLGSVKWDMDDPFAAMIQNKYAKRFMRAVSVGFRPLEYKANDKNDGGIVFTQQELLEISAVPVPAHPKALRKAFGTEEDHALLFSADSDKSREELKEVRGQIAVVLSRLDSLDEGITKLRTATSTRQTRSDPEPGMSADAINQISEIMARVKEG